MKILLLRSLAFVIRLEILIRSVKFHEVRAEILNCRTSLKTPEKNGHKDERLNGSAAEDSRDGNEAMSSVEDDREETKIVWWCAPHRCTV